MPRRCVRRESVRSPVAPGGQGPVDTVDGKPVRPQILAPALVGVPVPRGTHVVEIRYQGFPHLGLLFGFSALALAAVGAGPGLWARRRAAGSTRYRSPRDT